MLSIEWNRFVRVISKHFTSEISDIPRLFYFEDEYYLHVYFTSEMALLHSVVDKMRIENLDAFKTEFLINAERLTEKP